MDDTKDFKYASPSKVPNNIADPEYKPFQSRDDSMYSTPSQNDAKTNKSEDDSPHRRKLIRQSPNKKVKFAKMDQVERILNQSVELASKLNS
jgi:hypothetical protein